MAKIEDKKYTPICANTFVVIEKAQSELDMANWMSNRDESDELSIK